MQPTEANNERRNPLSLRVNSCWMLAGRVIQQGGLFLGLLLIHWLGSPEDAGKYVFGLAFCTPFVLLANMQLHVVISRNNSDEFNFRDCLLHRLSFLGIALAVIALSAMLIPGTALRAAVLTMGIAKCLESMSELYCSLHQRDQRMNVVAQSLVLRSVLGLLGLALGYGLSRNVAIGNLACAAGWLVALLLHDIPRSRILLHNETARPFLRWPDANQWRKVGALAWCALPLGVAMGVTSLEMNTPRFVVLGLLGEAELGVFSTLAALTMSGQLAMAAVAQSAVPRLAELHNADRHQELKSLAWKLYGVAIAIGVMMVIGMALVGKPLLYLLLGEQFAAQHGLLLIIGASSALQFGVAMLSTTLRSLGRYTASLLGHTAGFLATLTACVLLTSRFGVTGAAFGIVASAVGTSLLLAWSLRDVLFFEAASAPALEPPLTIENPSAAA